MKVLMFCHYFPSHKGGIEFIAEELYRSLSGKDQVVTWMASDASAPPDPIAKSHAVSLPVFNFVERKTGLPFPIPTFRALLLIISEVKKADVLLIHDCLYLSHIFAYLVAKIYGVPIMIIQHISYFSGDSKIANAIMWMGSHLFTNPMLKFASQVIYYSHKTMNYHSTINYKHKPEMIFNGVNTEIYRCIEGNETRQSLRQHFGLPLDGTVILFVGRFVAKKGIPSMKFMVEARPQWTWVFAGWGPLDPTKWNAPNVRVLTGLQGESMAALYRCCDLMVLPSIGEGFPLVIQEAVASGIPVVSGDETLDADPAIRAFAKGVLVSVGEDERTAKAFLPAIDESVLPGEMAEEKRAARHAYAEKNYSWSRAAERYLEIITRLVQGKAKNGSTGG